MRVETKLFYWLLGFFIVMTVIYTYFTKFEEPVGAVGLALTGAMCAMVAWYFGKTGRSYDKRPDDDLDGEIADQSGPYGHFAPYSWWPLWLALSGAAVFLGVAIGWWMVIIASPFLAIATVGWVFEYFRGEKAV